MKRLMVLAFVLLSLSMVASAQSRRGEGRIEMRNGDSTIRISVGNDSDRDIQLTRRVRLLEEAVRDLQAQVYDLREESRTRTVTTVVCSLKTSFDGTYIGKGSSQTEAEAIARNNCEKARAPFCGSTQVICEKVEEVLYY